MSCGPSYRFFYQFIFLAVFQSAFTQRRIKDGFDVSEPKKYMVYLLRAASAAYKYEGWTCGGAIVSEYFVITSAACVEDVKHMYVVAGYQTYVPVQEMKDDKCVSQKKKKVIQTCVPMEYQFEFNKTELWAKLDIAVVRVESPYNFADTTYAEFCSYTPQPIEFNTEGDFPENGVDVIVMGWGHTKEYRKETEFKDMNQKNLHYAATKIMDINKCAKEYEGNERLASFITKSMLCTLKMGNLNDQGKLIQRKGPGKHCNGTKEDALRNGGPPCDEYPQNEPTIIQEETLDYPEYDDLPGGDDYIGNIPSRFNEDTRFFDDITRRRVNNTQKHGNKRRQNGNNTLQNSNKRRQHGNNTKENSNKRRQNGNNTKENSNNRRPNGNNTKENNYETRQNGNSTKTGNNTKYGTNARRQEFIDVIEGEFEHLDEEPGVLDPHSKLDDSETNKPGICQNDHGGPLVGWRGSQEILVGIATLYKLNERRHCRGPYLYTKTSCNAIFLNCILNQNQTIQGINSRRVNCDDPKELGFTIVRRSISWIGHRDGPADNEKIKIRNQVPMSHFQPGLRQVNMQLSHKNYNGK